MKGDGSHGLPRRAVLAHVASAAVLSAVPALAGNAMVAEEDAIEPDLPIIDCHHHLFDWREPHPGRSAYRWPDLMTDIRRSGHNVTDTIFVECSTMYRTDGPADQRSLGETEYVRAVAEQSAAGQDKCRVATAMVGKVDLSVGARAQDILERHMEASNGRFRGVRNSIAWDEFAPLKAMGLRRDLLSDPGFRAGFAALSAMDLNFDVWLFHPQIPELTALARAFPNARIILNHVGSPLGIGPYADQKLVFSNWKAAMADLAKSENVHVKLGGLGPFWPPRHTPENAHSKILAREWKPYIETVIEYFDIKRCMFESNWPSNQSISSYGTIWNAFKRITERYSLHEKTALYRETAVICYQLDDHKPAITI
jgi:predicted TIM-barrel fold metal-dependent hydrolase